MQIENESDLVKRAQSGDREAMSRLWDQLTPKLFGYLINQLKDKTLAEDILQTTWLKIIKALPGFREKGYGFSAWVFTIARNECNQYWRKKQTDSLDEVINEPHTENTKNLNNQLLVESILSKLKTEDRELMQLRYISDMPLNEIAKVLNISFVAVRVRLHRALNTAKAIAKE